VQTWRGVLRRGGCALVALSVIAISAIANAAGEPSALAKTPAAPPGVILVDEYGNKIRPKKPKASPPKKTTPAEAQVQAPSTPEPVSPVAAEDEKPAFTAPAVAPTAEPEKFPATNAVANTAPVEKVGNAQAQVTEGTTPAAEPAVVVEDGMDASIPTPVLSASDIENTWFNTPGPVLARGEAVLVQRGEIGLRNMDGLARAILLGSSPEQMIQIAGLASQMAPDLPYARMEAARALRIKNGWSHEVVMAYVGAFKSVARNLEASLWFEAFVLRLLGWILALGSMAYLLLVALRTLPLAVHDISDLIPLEIPPFAGLALLGFLVLLPAALGEGAMGLALTLFIVGVCYAGMKQRAVLCAAVVALLMAVHGVGLAADARLEALGSPSLIKLVNTAFQGMLEPGEVARLQKEALSEGEPAPLVREAYASWLAREGRLEEAEAMYDQIVLAENSLIPVYLLNNAANIKIKIKKLPEATALYQHAEALITAGFGAPEEQALVLLNLSRAYGENFKLNKQDDVMHRAQAASEITVTQLLAQAKHDNAKTFDLLPSTALMQKMLLAEGVATRGDLPLQRILAPGIVGGNPLLGGAGFALALFLAAMVIKLRPQSFSCESCGCSCCPRCRKESSVKHQLCMTCVRLLKRPETVEVNLRIEKIAELKQVNKSRNRKAIALGVLVPGAAGLLVNRPVLALISLFAAVVPVIVWKARLLVLPDPYLVGGADEIVLGVLLSGAGLTYLLLLLVLVPLRRKA